MVKLTASNSNYRKVSTTLLCSMLRNCCAVLGRRFFLTNAFDKYRQILM